MTEKGDGGWAELIAYAVLGIGLGLILGTQDPVTVEAVLRVVGAGMIGLAVGLRL